VAIPLRAFRTSKDFLMLTPAQLVEQRLDGLQAQLQGGAPPDDLLPELHRLYQQAPTNLGVLSLSMYVHQLVGNMPQAEFLAEQLVQQLPKNPDAHVNLATIRAAQPSRQNLALASYRAAFELTMHPSPPHLGAFVGCANLLMAMGQPQEAYTLCDDASARGLRATDLALTQANALQALTHSEEALALVDQVLVHDPECVPAHALGCSIAQQVATLSREQVAQRHRTLGTLFQVHVRPMEVQRPKASDAQRPLTMGLMSPDLHTHSVAFFLEPLLEHLPRERITLKVYHTSGAVDATTKRLKARLAPRETWLEANSLNDAQLAERIAHDKVDILLDTAGLTRGHRLGVLALKPAPLQATYCGYPDTTGLATVDLRIVDGVTDPVGGGNDALVCETLARVPGCFLCYRASDDAPGVTPRDPHAPLVLGSFNAARKISPKTAALWSQALLAIPDSTLALKSPETSDPGVQRAILARFTPHGVASRVRFLNPTPTPREHLAAYAEIDIALDPFPYHGTTTTCEALWMGVPVVTRVGERHASRVGLSLLTAAGLADQCAATSDEAFVEKLVGFARDRAALAQLRASLRARVATSPLCDAPAFAKRFADTLHTHWRRACGV
jgi:protein O-GlcNAc transferase